MHIFVIFCCIQRSKCLFLFCLSPSGSSVFSCLAWLSSCLDSNCPSVSCRVSCLVLVRVFLVMMCMVLSLSCCLSCVYLAWCVLFCIGHACVLLRVLPCLDSRVCCLVSCVLCRAVLSCAVLIVVSCVLCLCCLVLYWLLCLDERRNIRSRQGEGHDPWTRQDKTHD
jgi:hypothetical protein